MLQYQIKRFAWMDLQYFPAPWSAMEFPPLSRLVLTGSQSVFEESNKQIWKQNRDLKVVLIFATNRFWGGLTNNWAIHFMDILI